MAIGSFGDVSFEVPETLGVSGEYGFPFVQVSKVSGYPALQVVGEELATVQVRLRFSENYNIPNPQAGFDNFLIAASARAPRQLHIGKQIYGLYVIERLRWEVTEMTDQGDALVIDCTVNFLQSKD